MISYRCPEILVNEIYQTYQDNPKDEFSENITLNSPQIQENPKFKVIIQKIKYMQFLIQNKISIMLSLPILFFDDIRKDRRTKSTSRNFGFSDKT